MIKNTFTYLGSGTWLAISLCCSAALLVGVWLSLAPGSRAAPVEPEAVVLSIQPALTTVFPGQILTVSLQLAGVTDAGGYEATILYDPAKLQYQAGSHPAPGFLAVNGRAQDEPAGDVLHDLSLGRLTTAGYSFASGNPVGANGSGVLARFRFKALAPGLTQLAFSSELLYPNLVLDTDGVAIVFSTQAGSVDIDVPFIKIFLPAGYR